MNKVEFLKKFRADKIAVIVNNYEEQQVINKLVGDTSEYRPPQFPKTLRFNAEINISTYYKSCNNEFEIQFSDIDFTEHKFKVGDRVIHDRYGLGTIIADDETPHLRYRVRCDLGYTEWCSKSELTKLPIQKNYKTIIETVGDTTTARRIADGKTVKTVTVKRYVGDKFNLDTATIEAVNKLIGIKKVEEKLDVNLNSTLNGCGASMITDYLEFCEDYELIPDRIDSLEKYYRIKGSVNYEQ